MEIIESDDEHPSFSVYLMAIIDLLRMCLRINV